MLAVADAFSLPIPLPGKRFAVIQFPPDTSDKEYDRIMAFLEFNRDVVLTDNPSGESNPPAEEEQ
jgi:hypothetical protein